MADREMTRMELIKAWKNARLKEESLEAELNVFKASSMHKLLLEMKGKFETTEKELAITNKALTLKHFSCCSDGSCDDTCGPAFETCFRRWMEDGKKELRAELVKEKKLVNKYAYSMDKAKSERDAAEKRADEAEERAAALALALKNAREALNSISKQRIFKGVVCEREKTGAGILAEEILSRTADPTVLIESHDDNVKANLLDELIGTARAHRMNRHKTPGCRCLETIFENQAADLRKDGGGSL